ncbi:hypothetical protein [Sulfurimonas sp.]|uniref:hypothetical protein n=1 Tax=Sulfurimonas sp. TaxID=2022749 RepID=UPI003562E125
MYYNIPNVNRYINTIIRFRKLIILMFSLLAITGAIFVQPKFLSSDELFWLNDSSEFQRTKNQNYQTYRQSKLIVSIKNFDENALSELRKLHKNLLEVEGVQKVSSLFSNDFVCNKNNENPSGLVVVLNSNQIDTLKLKKLVKLEHNSYSNIVDKDFKTFYYYINATQKLDLSSIKIPGEFVYLDKISDIDWNGLFIFALIFVVIITILFRILFRNYIAAISAIIFLTISTILTFTTIILLTDIYTIHITMPFITVTIGLVEFLYFYYRWHVSQYSTNKLTALRKMVNRNMTPAIWTSILTLLGLGSLVFIDSDIIKLLSLSLIISSFTSYILNLTLLPALLSFFKLEHTHVQYAKLSYMLTSSELHYNKNFLYIFLAGTYLLAAIGVFSILSKSHNFFSLQVQNEQIELKIPYEKIDPEFILSVKKFTDELQNKFEDEVSEVYSIVSLIEELNEASSKAEDINEEAILQALFYMDLYDLNEKYFDENALNITVDLFDINKLELLEWLKNYKNMELYFLDKNSLLSIAKYDQAILLASSLLFALLIIGTIIAWIFRSYKMAFVAFTTNAIPIIWFGLFITLFNIPLSLEMLIAMTISVGLASDATIHFAYKYFRLRYFGRSLKHTLDKLFFYAAVPVFIGSVVLISVFASLYFSQIQSLQLIGLYSAILISISLVTDLLILPVMLLFVDKFDTKEQSP